MAPVACRPIIKCGKSGCTGSCPLSVVAYGYKAGRKPPTCRACGKTVPRPNVTLSDSFSVKSEVMEDCTESHQAEINRKIRANDKLRKIPTNVSDEHKSLIYGDSQGKNAVVG